MSPDHRFIVATETKGKGDVEIIDATTLELVSSYPSPNVIKSCHVFGDQPWYIVFSCFNNSVYVMEGETGRLRKTTKEQDFEVLDVSNSGHCVLRYNDDKFHYLAEECFATKKLYYRKCYLSHLAQANYLPKVIHCSYYCVIDAGIRFSNDGLLLAYHFNESITVIKTSDGSLYQRVSFVLDLSSPILDFSNILFVSETWIIVYLPDVLLAVIMFISLKTNEIQHRFCVPKGTGKLHVVPPRQGEPLSLLTDYSKTGKCVSQYTFYNLDL
jgi:hypothetical protein